MEKGFKKAGEACFWAALFIELVIVVIEKSAYTNPYESLVFRLTFLLFCIKILSTKYARRMACNYFVRWTCSAVILDK